MWDTVLLWSVMSVHAMMWGHSTAVCDVSTCYDGGHSTAVCDVSTCYDGGHSTAAMTLGFVYSQN